MAGGGGNDALIGGGGDDTLNGGTEAGDMSGGLGNDVYIVNDVGDAISEAFNAGRDGVRSDISFTPGFNIEDLTLSGVVAVNGSGIELANVLRGNLDDDMLFGNSNNDTLSGGAGADTLTGGAGADVFLFDTAPVAGVLNRVADFASGVDSVWLSLAGFDPGGSLGLVARSLAMQ